MSALPGIGAAVSDLEKGRLEPQSQRLLSKVVDIFRQIFSKVQRKDPANHSVPRELRIWQVSKLFQALAVGSLFPLTIWSLLNSASFAGHYLRLRNARSCAGPMPDNHGNCAHG